MSLAILQLILSVIYLGLEPGSPCLYQHQGLSASSRWHQGGDVSSPPTGNLHCGIWPWWMQDDPATLPWVYSLCTVVHCAHLGTHSLELPTLSFCVAMRMHFTECSVLTRVLAAELWNSQQSLCEAMTHMGCLQPGTEWGKILRQNHPWKTQHFSKGQLGL